MTRDEIWRMDAGRELDALVSEKLMGWTEFSPIDPKIDYGVGVNGYRRNYAKDPDGRLTWFPFYSTDITAAWEIIGKFDEISVRKYQTVSPGFRYICRIDIDGEDVIANGLTAPEAICKAALLTLIERGESF
ncbi:MAG: hypothetical protein K0Q81_664 [Paenibacillus sp.]|nr:hypothetical protein [Paenibacillus sp.]